VSLALYTVAVIDLTLAFYHDLKAFVFNTGQGGAMSEFVNISDWIRCGFPSKTFVYLIDWFPLQSVTVVVQVLIADAMLVGMVSSQLSLANGGL